MKKSYKVGIELPKTVKQALAMDVKNGKTLWVDAISNEMESVRVAFEVLPDGKSAPLATNLCDAI